MSDPPSAQSTFSALWPSLTRQHCRLRVRGNLCLSSLIHKRTKPLSQDPAGACVITTTTPEPVELEGSRPRARCAPQAARLQVGHPLNNDDCILPFWRGRGLPWLSCEDVGSLQGIRGLVWVIFTHRWGCSRPRVI